MSQGPIGGGGRARLSSQDQAIFAELQRDGRIAVTALADRLGLSEAHVRRRLKSLTGADAFTVTAVADPGVLGLNCLAWIGLETRPSHAERAARALVDTPGVDYVVICSGRFNLMCEVACPEVSDLEAILARLRGTEGVIRTETFIYTSLLHQQFQWGSKQWRRVDAPGGLDGVTISATQLNRLDIEIVRELERDGRAPFREIARLLGISERVVSTRFSKLVDDNVLKVMAVGNPHHLGFDAMAWLGITLDPGVDHDEVARALASVPMIDYVVVPSGRYDLMAEIVCRDHDELLGCMTDQVGIITGISYVETFLYLRLLYRSSAGAWGVGRSLASASLS